MLYDLVCIRMGSNDRDRTTAAAAIVYCLANQQYGLEINSNQAKSVIFTNLTENQAVWSFNER